MAWMAATGQIRGRESEQDPERCERANGEYATMAGFKMLWRKHHDQELETIPAMSFNTIVCDILLQLQVSEALPYDCDQSLFGRFVSNLIRLFHI